MALAASVGVCVPVMSACNIELAAALGDLRGAAVANLVGREGGREHSLSEGRAERF